MKDKPILWVFLAFVLGFALPVCSCVGTGLVTMASLSQIGQQPLPRGLAAGDAVAVVRLDGSITAGSQDFLTTAGITPDRVRSLLDRASADPSIKAVVVRVNSPGGSVVASDEIYRTLLSYGKPVVISMGDTAASGGYYIACGGDYVMAHPDTLTGSIGVISQFLNVEGLLDKVGVEPVIITTGPYKDIGTPYRDMTEEEREIWQEILDQIYEDFVAVVAEARNLPREDVREIADGSIFTGRQAQELGLVDEVGTRQDAIDKAAELATIEGEPRVIELRSQPTFLDMVYSFQARSIVPTLEEITGWAGTPSLQFRMPAP
ncbi:MAG: signal peptide peptidase SppA [Anaerolineae bacterium]|nr:signal peptide peptidase SppA [Anaerolineae bacterium]